jgi:hypothetical protein
MTMVAEREHPTLERLDDQISWYDRKSSYNQRWYRRLKIITLVSGALIPALAMVQGFQPVAAGLGVVIVIVEGLQQLNQYQNNWTSYRSTCESLKHEKYLFLAEAGPYATVEKPISLLAERIEGLVSQEHAKWVSSREEAAKDRSKQTGK